MHSRGRERARAAEVPRAAGLRDSGAHAAFASMGPVVLARPHLILIRQAARRRRGRRERRGTWTAGVAIAPAVPAAATPRRRERRALRASRAAAAAAQAPQRRALPPSAASGAMLWLGPIVW